MDLLTKALLEDLLDTQKTVAIYGGGFKPPTKGHFTVAELALKELPDIDELKIFVGGGVRDGITQNESIQVWDIYKKYLSPKVSVEPSVAPVKSVLGYAKENPDTKVYWVLGARDGEESDLEDIKNRTKSLDKYPNLEVKVITSKGGISGTKTRAAIKANNKEQFLHMIPNIDHREQDQVWNIVSPVIKESMMDDIKTKIQKFISAIKQEGQETREAVSLLIKAAKGDIELSDEQKEQIGNQLKDVLKTIGLTAIAVLPGGFIAGTLIKIFKAESLVTPSAFVNEISKDPTPDDITRILKRTGDEQDLYVKDWDEFTPELCNDGFCDIFAEKFREEYPGAELWQTSASTSSWGFGHTWVKYKDKFYDAETPNGVKDWRDLPYIQRLYQVGKEYPEDAKRINEVGEANLQPYKWKEIDRESYYVYTRFVTDSETQYDVDIKSTVYFPAGQMESRPALEIEFTAKPKGAEGSSAKIVVNKGEMYRVMATIVDIIKKYIKKFKAQAIIYSPSKKSSEENFGTQRDNLYRAFISKAIPGVTFKQSGDFITAILPPVKEASDPQAGTALPYGSGFAPVKESYQFKISDKNYDNEDNSLITVEYKFSTPDNTYRVEFYSGEYSPESKTFDVSFGLDKGYGSKLDTFQMTGENNALNILKTIVNIIIDFTNKFEVNKLVINPTSEKRGKVYSMILKSLPSNILNKIELIQETVTSTEVICDNCGWEWKIEDGGKDLYICHKCGHDNTPKSDDPFGLNELARQFLKEALIETWNPEESFVSLSRYMIDNGMNIKPLPKIKVIKDDEQNASDLLGKTAYYNPTEKSITLYTMDRHPKDILRSFAHEMVHHEQNLDGRLGNINTTNTNEDGDLPEIEREAYEKGNMMLRNWEDKIKNV
jgi:hypothetical protein